MAPSVAPPDEPAPGGEPLPRGAAVGRYLILAPLGRGGMGVVYLAYDPVLDRRVALKLLSSGGPVEGQARLLREAQAMARLQHPAVLVVHDVGTIEGQVFIAMEYVDGSTLGRWLEAPRPLGDVLRVFLQAGRGLAAAHAAGLVHRDFKPDNVLLGKDGRVRVGDFGLARSAEAPPAGEDAGVPPDGTAPEGTGPATALGLRLTQTGALLGTPAYMAPEQFLGWPGDERTDQFSFCVALYEALYQARPFAGDSPEALAREALEGRVREPPPGSPVPGPLHRAVLRGLQPRPGDRHPAMEPLLEHLSRDPHAPRRRALRVGLGAGTLLLAAAAWHHAAERPARLCRGAEDQLRGLWDAPQRAAVNRALLAAGKPYAAGAFAEVDRLLTAYRDAWAAMHRESCEATRVRGEQSEELLDLRAQCLRQRRGEAQALVDLLGERGAQVAERAVQAAYALPGLQACADGAALRAQVRPPADAAARARVEAVRARLARGKALRDAGQYREGSEVAAAALATAREAGHAPTLAEAAYLHGDLCAEGGESKAAEESLREAVDAAISGRHGRVAAQAAARLVFVVGFQLARHREGHLWARQAEAHLQALGGDDEERARLLIGRATVLIAEARYGDAGPLVEEALALRRRVFGPGHPAVAGALLLRGNVAFYQERHDEALRAYGEALPIWERAQGPEHPYVAYCLNNIAGVYQTLGRYDEARAPLSRALAIEERALGPEHPDIASPLTNLGSDLLHQGRAAEAAVPLRRALAVVEKARGVAHPAVAEQRRILAEALEKEGRLDEARAELTEALKVQEAALGREHPDLAKTRAQLARLPGAAKK